MTIWIMAMVCLNGGAVVVSSVSVENETLCLMRANSYNTDRKDVRATCHKVWVPNAKESN